MDKPNETRGIVGFIAILISLVALAASLLVPASDPKAQGVGATAQALSEKNATDIAFYHPSPTPTFIPLPTDSPLVTPTPDP